MHGCAAQEWVDFDFEMRLYFLPPPEWPKQHPIEPRMIQCAYERLAVPRSEAMPGELQTTPDRRELHSDLQEPWQVGVSRASFSKVSEVSHLS